MNFKQALREWAKSQDILHGKADEFYNVKTR